MRPVPRFLLNFDLARLLVAKTDVLIIGSGLAGLYTALKLAGRYRVLVVTKDDPEANATALAQGGIAAALAEADSPQLHFEDTLAAGAGLGCPAAALALAREGPARVGELLALGVPFDREDGRLALGREGAHSRHRILHAGGDATGKLIWQTLAARVAGEAKIRLLPKTVAVDLLTADGRCAGALVLFPDGSPGVILAGATVLACGGAGRLFPVTTNPPGATGDGVAMAYRAGAEVMDLEFFQFHPTALAHPGAAGFLVSEAVRGEGAVLRNEAGERFMPAYHPLAELAPRDVVARAMAFEMRRGQTDCVYLDLTRLDPELVERRFPTIVAACRRLGLDPRRAWLPVAPAAHYFMGGVRTDLYGRTSLPGLYACGEVACTGVHGANRLASNSLLEGLVFGARVAASLLGERLAAPPVPDLRFGDLREEGAAAEALVEERLAAVMGRWAGLVREAAGLEQAGAALDELWQVFEHAACGRRGVERRNLLLLARLLLEAALWRRESRGAHYRADFPAPDIGYRKHLLLARGREPGEIPVE